MAIAAWCVRRTLQNPDVAVWLESAFLTLAWFWFLSPTLNPWYWTWVMPLLVFARSRVWQWMSGVVMLYYLRFWFIYQFPDTPLAGTPYAGAAFFDFVVTWLEFGPWLACLFSVTSAGGREPLVAGGPSNGSGDRSARSGRRASSHAPRGVVAPCR